MTDETKAAPLAGLRIVEFAGIGPGPFAGMMLADMGAEIIRVDRPGAKVEQPHLDFLARGRKSVTLDLKRPAGVEAALQLIATSDGLIEGFRPGVMERLGLGPDPAMARNPALVYGRMTGWGQNGALSHSAGHDLNYIAITGALWSSGCADRPPAFAMNLLGDFGGGGMFLAYGMLAALIRVGRTGVGDVVDAAICDGTAALMAMTASRRAKGQWRDARQSNLLDGGVPWYGVYPCADGEWITIAAVEPQFWAQVLELLAIPPEQAGDRNDPATWPALRQTLSAIIRSQTRDHWIGLLGGTDACFAPVLSPAEAAIYPHNAERQVFSSEGPLQPMPAPRFTQASTPLPNPAPVPGADTEAILTSIGLDGTQIEAAQGNAN
ncbi:CaiB/BaiF CoA-transferase family protein [Pseudooceanicola sp.]|uniref:CaiB/BaiF CoA transferase family protein n=1 Tax=Pseudooceanicola sp. TaxID=1914328 RepID=UPI0026245990|nr:CaiB/BaiF CoA-transferase family protein [Pseudooceanicola sp.]MDF1856821.1 CaiB/BaiF CoA-transferase family protein [Pseudooceanicola sp.]